MPERASASINRTTRGLPRTSRSTLGIASVRGLMRSPRPAARIMAFIWSKSEGVADALFLRLELLQQAPERAKLAIPTARAPQVAHHERLVFQIAVLAVPKGKTREYSQHLELPLDPHPLEIPVEIREIAGDRELCCPGFLPVADRPIDDAFLVPGDVRVAQERDQIVGDRTVHRVLKIENSGAGLAHHEVAGMVVAVHEHLRLPEVAPEDRRKHVLQGLELCRIQLALQLARDVPVREKAQFPLEQFPVVVGQQPRTARALNLEQRVERVFVELCGVALVERIQVGRVAQIRKQKKTLFKILRVDRRHVHARGGEQARNMNERSAVLLVGRRVHRDERRLCLAAANPVIAPEARVVGGGRDAEIAASEGHRQPSPQLLCAVQKSSGNKELPSSLICAILAPAPKAQVQGPLICVAYLLALRRWRLRCSVLPRRTRRGRGSSCGVPPGTVTRVPPCRLSWTQIASRASRERTPRRRATPSCAEETCRSGPTH